MSGFSASHFAVINDGCPIEHDVFGSNAVRVVFGEVPEALELEFDYDSMRELAKASASAVAEMKARYAEYHGEELEDDDDDDYRTRSTLASSQTGSSTSDTTPSERNTR